MKPGYKTTEFWITLGTAAITLLSTTGVIDTNQLNLYSDMLTKGILALATLINTALYIYGRIKLKAGQP